jgi:hypothetical protein
MGFSDIQSVAKTASINVGEALLPPVSYPPRSSSSRDPWPLKKSRPIIDRTAESLLRPR